ncbi:hypothetical protein [Histidinibacterium aquaticum]|uniref:Antifreeze glycopeptide n=1 Tax=Histidinibacterium aquaticum TaxID=2613962 RepID=A0A5J5GMJ9_9RHOB|nr:hypothetical protein [Histidinibacterium aquaticum]KAA9008712.1 hypothetical protein F3S47_05450 [Histidinibacterium aquaticum]
MRHAAALCLMLAAGAVQAQEETSRPLSAIDWLSESVNTPDPLSSSSSSTDRPARAGEDPIADSANIPEVTVQPLGSASPDPVGVLAPELTGLPRSLWAGSEVETVAALIAAERIETLPALRDLMRLLLLAEADAPRGAGPEAALFLARIDKLLDLGALDPAWEMLDAAKPDRPALFRRYFDVALLTSREAQACRLMDEMPELAPTLDARIFCLANQGDWPAAALTLNTAQALGDVSARDEALLTRFLDPEVFEGLPPLPVPDRPTPLDFRLREGIGEALPTTDMPRAFAHADLREINGWKARLEAAERLARVGAVDDAVLLDLYTLRSPAASGSVWDRAAAIQALDTALAEEDAEEVADALPEAWAAMEEARTEVPFARLFADRLRSIELPERAEELATRIGLLSDIYEEIALGMEPETPQAELLKATALGQAAETVPPDEMAAAVRAAFAGAEPPAPLMQMVEEDRLGEAILRAVAIFDNGIAGDPEAVTEALAFLRAVGLEDTARRAALQLLLLDRRP